MKFMLPLDQVVELKQQMKLLDEGTFQCVDPHQCVELSLSRGIGVSHFVDVNVHPKLPTIPRRRPYPSLEYTRSDEIAPSVVRAGTVHPSSLSSFANPG